MSRLGLFLFSEPKNIVDDYVYYLLDDLTRNVDQFCVIVNNFECKKYFERYSDDIIIKSEDADIEIWKNDKKVGENAPKQNKSGNFVSAIVSPFYEKEAHSLEEAEALRKEVDENVWKYGDYITLGTRLATALGLEVYDINDKLGGWEFMSGDNAGKRVEEISQTWVFRFPEGMPKDKAREKTDLFASLLGDLTSEQQEAVISADYVSKDDPEANALEFTIGVNDVDKALQTLRSVGISDFTIDTNERLIKLDYFENKEDEAENEKQLREFENRFYNLKAELKKDGNLDGRGEERTKKASRLLDTSDRRDKYETWLVECLGRQRKSSSTPKKAHSKPGS